MKFKADWFLLGMVAATALAWAWPGPGAAGGWLYPEVLTKAGVALLFFLHGLALAFAALRAGVLNWRLHSVVQGCTFLLFPLLGVALTALLAGRIAPELNLACFPLCAAVDGFILGGDDGDRGATSPGRCLTRPFEPDWSGLDAAVGRVEMQSTGRPGQSAP